LTVVGVFLAVFVAFAAVSDALAVAFFASGAAFAVLAFRAKKGKARRSGPPPRSFECAWSVCRF
jgi:hypothetical protein